MSTFEWSSDYNIGIKVIDQQHRRIIDYINQVYAAPKSSAARAELKEVLTNLIDYTLSHFAFEEALLEEANYADLQEHQLTHANFCNLIEHMQTRFNSGDDVSTELAELLQRWLLQHILTDDRSYARIIKTRFLGRPTARQLHWVQAALARHFQ